MALFGAPVAHEDDPERAVRAALAIRDRAREEVEFQVRIGITTGEVLVALGARPHAGEGMASGDVVNTAARLQSAAPENGMLVDGTTFRATSRTIEYGDQRVVAAKGKAHGIAAWDVVQARARVHVERGGGAQLVGRKKELDVLRGALRRARDDREPQLVTLVGVPGIGKSRLVLELFKAIEAERELIAWRRGRSLPYGEGVSFWALAEVVKAQAGIQETDVEDAAAAKLREAIAAIGQDGSEAQWLERHLLPLVGIATDDALGGDRRSEAFAAWRRFLEALAEQRPLVLVFEDLHFADDGLIDFIDYLVDWARGVPLLVVATARPELLSRKPGWGGGKANATTLSLASLSDEETSTLVQTLLERRSLPVELHETLLARAGGNPLYAEEFVRTLSERRSSAELPETVHGLIAGRIDALPADEKALLQDAAVVGRVFWLGAAADLAQIGRWTAEERLHLLERKEFVRRERRSAVTGEVEYSSTTCSCETSPTDRCRGPSARTSTGGLPSGSTPSAGRETRPSSSRITTRVRSSSPARRGVRPLSSKRRRVSCCATRAIAPSRSTHTPKPRATTTRRWSSGRPPTAGACSSSSARLSRSSRTNASRRSSSERRKRSWRRTTARVPPRRTPFSRTRSTSAASAIWRLRTSSERSSSFATGRRPPPR